MAFSSLYGFMQQPRSASKRRSDAALKRYESASDPRAWSMDKLEKSTFIQEILTQKGSDSSSDGGSSPYNLTESVKNIDVMSKDDLVKQIKV